MLIHKIPCSMIKPWVILILFGALSIEGAMETTAVQSKYISNNNTIMK